MPTITAKCKLELKGIIKIGEVVIIEPILYEKDTVIVNDFYLPNHKTQKNGIAAPKVIAPKGSYKGYVVRKKNGLSYGDDVIKNYFGYKTLYDIFEKI